MKAEPWLRGPIEGISPWLMPAAHALLQAREDLLQAAQSLTNFQLQARPGNAPSIAFHLRHIAGSIDRLLTYTANKSLDEQQFEYLRNEENDSETIDAATLTARAISAIDESLRVIRETPESTLGEKRYVGRSRLPTTVLGLLFHIAEHTQRHTGQLIATAQVVRHRES